MSDEVKAVPLAKKVQTNDMQKAVDELMSSWPIQILTSFVPGGNVIKEILEVLIEYIVKVEKAVAIKGAGVAKKSIVEESTVKFIIDKYPAIAPFEFIVDWGVSHIIDWIVDAKNKFGWDWIPIVK